MRVFYFISSVCPFLIAFLGILWSTGWEIIGFFLAAGALGVINLILGGYLLVREDGKNKGVIVLCLFLGGAVPTFFLLYLLSQ